MTSAQLKSGKNYVASFIKTFVNDRTPLKEYEEYESCMKKTGTLKKKILKVADTYERLKEDFNVSDTVRAIFDKAGNGTLLWSLAGHEGIPALISSFCLQGGGLTVRRLLRENLLSVHQLHLCARLVCGADRRLQVNPAYPDVLGTSARKCAGLLSKNPTLGCPFIVARREFRATGIIAIGQQCCASFFPTGFPRAVASNVLSKLPPSTWETMVDDLKFCDYIIRVSLGERVLLYAANETRKRKRMENALIGWGEPKGSGERRQLVGQTFQIFQSAGHATYTVQDVLFGGSNNINELMVTSSLDGDVSHVFFMTVRSHRDGYLLRMKFSSIHPFPRMSRHIAQIYLNTFPISFSRCPDTVLWITAEMY